MASLALTGLLPRLAAAQVPPPQPCATQAPTCNLVWNGSFEQNQNGTCPTGDGGFLRGVASPGPGDPPDYPGYGRNTPICVWTNANRASCDYFGACDTGPYPIFGLVNGPANGGGLPRPARTGNGCGGFYTLAARDYTTPGVLEDYREYMAQPVALQPNVAYYAEAWIALASVSSWTTPTLTFGLAPTGAAYAGTAPIPAYPAANGVRAVLALPLPTATGTWTRLGGLFTAPTDAASRDRLVIGNFGPAWGNGPGPAYTVRTGVANARPNSAYYFVDDVSLLPVPTAGPARTVRCGQYLSLGSGCALPASSGAIYQWSPTTGLYGPTTPNPTLVVGPNTPASYTLTVTLPGGQTSVSTVAITLATPAVSVSASQPGGASSTGSATVCGGGTMTLTASGGDGQNYTWSPATGLSATTGYTVTANVPASGSITYTISSRCGAATSFTLTGQPNCCALTVAQSAGTTIVNVAGTYSTATGSPFLPATAGPRTYRVTAPVTLQNLAYALPANAQVLVEPNCPIQLIDGASLEVAGATLTAACGQMWDGLYVRASAAGLLVRQGDNGQRPSIQHSLNGLVLDEPTFGTVPPYFQIGRTDFRHNRLGVDVWRERVASRTGDYVSECSFDSDPLSFKSPQSFQPAYQPATQRYYSDAHLRLSGDLRLTDLSANTFAHAIVGVGLNGIAHGQYVWFTLVNNIFTDCYYAGVLSGDLFPGYTLPGGVPGITLTGNTFTLPEAQPNTTQRNSGSSGSLNIPRFGDPAACYGAQAVYPTVEASGNVFRQLDQSARYSDYNFTAVREPQTGLQALVLRSALNNTFQTLAVGLSCRLASGGIPLDIRGNSFADCATGATVLNVVAGANSAVPSVLFTTCNTFRPLPPAQRAGTAYGLVLQGSSPTALRLDDYNNPTPNTAILKDLFDPNGRSTNQFKNIWNLSGFGVNYRTFNAQVNPSSLTRYQLYAAGATSTVNFSGGGQLNAMPLPGADPNFFPCRLVGFPDTGIQQRAGAAYATGSAAATLAQNVPNPCSGNTSVEFRLPIKTSHATLILRRGIDGTEVMQVPLKGQATQCQLDIRILPAGLYFYTLLADGVPVQTKRMLIQ